MDSFELSDRLRYLERWGVQVPHLNFSNNMPHYVETTEDGVEVYQPGGIRVPAGCVIDSHGNVVNLQSLEQQFLVVLSKPLTSEHERKPRYDPTFTIPFTGENDSANARAELRTKYPDILGSLKETSLLDIERILHPERHPAFSKPSVRDYIK
jgi:hypothetical protein